MITAADFRDQWGSDDLVVFPPETTSVLKVSTSTKSFLNSAGLPESASPFLDFQSPEHGPLQTAAEQWQLSSDFDRYRVIGSNGSGDPICIDEAANGQIVYLNHDDGFRRILINSSVHQLAESLLAYGQLVRETQARNGEDAYLDGNIPDDLKDRLRDELTRIDSVAVSDGCHWSIEFANLPDRAT